MSDDEVERRAAEDAFSRAALGIPLDEKLRAMSYITLCDFLSDYQPGTTQHAVIEREKVRRDLIENANLSRPAQSFFSHPVTTWVVGIVSAIIIAIASKFIFSLF